MTLTNGGLINVGSRGAQAGNQLALSDGLACFIGSFSGVTTTSISHGLGSTDLVVEFKDSLGNLLIPDNWSITNLNVIEAEFSPAATGDVTIIACIESGLAPIRAGVLILEGLSGIIDLDSPNGSIDISTSGQVINLNAIFTATSGALLEQKCRDIDILSGLIGTGGGGSGVSIELFFTPTSGNNFVLEHGLNTNLFTWDMWSTDFDPIRTIQPTNVYPSGGNHVAVELDWPASGRLVLTTGGTSSASDLFTPASGALLEQKCEDIDTISGLVVNATTDVQTVLSHHIESNQRSTDAESIHGVLHQLLTGVTLNTSTTQTPTNGIGKLVLVPNAGADVDGTIIVSGTVIDRDTGAESTGISQIPITGVSTDSLTTDAEGNPIYNIINAYITDVWFKGAVTIHTPDTNISDLDVYQCSFEQWNDVSGVMINTFDSNLLTTNMNSWAYMYLYTVETSGFNNTLCSINNISSLSVSKADSISDRYWRLRRGNIDRPIVGIRDGIFANVFFGTTTGHIQDFTMKIWATLTTDLDTE